jgi:hypothetical protein
MTKGIRLGAVLLLLSPAFAVAQDQTPAPPKQETVTVRVKGGAFEIKGASAASFFEFTQRCEPTQGIEVSNVLLTLPLDREADANGSIERASAVLREAAGKGIEVAIEPSSEAGKVAAFYWGGSPTFQGVIESLNVKYTMFMPDGTPVRATVNLRMKQATRLLNKGEAKEGSKPGEKKKSDCPPAQQ